MGQHYLDPVQYLLGKDDTSPVEIEADAPKQDSDACGMWRRVEMKYADGCKIILDSSNKAEPFLQGPEGEFPGILSSVPGIQKKLAQLPEPKTPEPKTPEPKTQVTDFLEAVKTRKKFALNEQNGHRSCTPN